MDKYIRTQPRETESLRAVSFSFVSVFYLQYLPCTFQLLSHIMRNVWGGRDNELEIGRYHIHLQCGYPDCKSLHHMGRRSGGRKLNEFPVNVLASETKTLPNGNVLLMDSARYLLCLNSQSRTASSLYA